MTELSTLERKRLSDLHQIASQLGIKQYRKYRKPELAEMIYKVATEQAASQQAATNGAAAASPEAAAEAPAVAPANNGEVATPA
ncbi:MAG: Rho termination factor N-terminal domain-containing protein, partial [Actinomycetota bacterium]|nr:Rho termination factor N-terminal domain-containing protein [Actinomycetota bacterium]